MSAIHRDIGRVKAVVGEDADMYYNRLYTMSEIARLSGYARSNRFLLFLYEMVDRGYLAKQLHNPKIGKGICDVNILFMLPDTARMYHQSDMFDFGQERVY